MKELLYSSIALNPANIQLEDILKASIKNNQLNGVTGILVFNTTTKQFLQLIEGSASAIDLLFEKIVVDERHISVRCIYSGPIKERAYKSWFMGLICIDSFEFLADQFHTPFNDLPPNRASRIFHQIVKQDSPLLGNST